jgi:hypothetical protein
MPSKSSETVTRLLVKPSVQISESHCGPAVVQMLLANLGIEVTQEAITEAGDAVATIEEYGMRVDQLAQAVRQVAPEVAFWYKTHSRINDLITAIHTYKHPVGVEWQGLFDSVDEILEDEDDEDEESDYGHYSIISYIDRRTRQLIIIDPYKDFVDQERIFPIAVFRRRWWDTNLVTDPQSGKGYYLEDRRLMFVLTFQGETFPIPLGMKKL